MIWSDPVAPGDSREALCRHLVTEMAGAYGDSAPEHAHEIAEAVATYCTEHHGEFTASSEYISFLVFRALRAQAAQTFTRDRPSSVLETAIQFSDVPPVLWSAFSARLIRPSRWLVGNGRVIWVLDLSRFRFDAELFLELAFHQAIRAILVAVAEIWDGTAGNGILGLRGTVKFSHSTMEVQNLCCDILEKIKAERSWILAPRVLDLDVSVAARKRR